MQCESGGVILEGTQGEAAWKNSNAEEGGGGRGGWGTSYLCGFLPPGAEDGEMPGCLAVAHSAGRMRENFMYRHFFARIAVVQEGREPMTRCDLCGMYMPAGRLLKHQRMKWCDQNTQMRWRRWDVVITSRHTEAYFSLTGEYNAECIYGVETFKYLGRMLYRSNKNWTEVLQNSGKAHWVWIWLRKMLQREGAEP